MKQLNVEVLNNEYRNKSPEATIRRIISELGSDHVILASSMSIEDQILTDMLLQIHPRARIFFIDTGRHFQNTYDLMEETMKKYHFRYEIYAPERMDLETEISKYGPNFFYESIELRKKCCEIRKIKPLKRVLGSVDGWICGLRRDQSITRTATEIYEWDQKHSIYKFNPIAHWNEDQVWSYIKEHNVPYSKLYDNGYPSIGCMPCTREVLPGEDIRSGRWWWEEPEKRECGLHIKTEDHA